jgi:chorismate mutase/prephenate dehydrogenase
MSPDTRNIEKVREIDAQIVELLGERTRLAVSMSSAEPEEITISSYRSIAESLAFDPDAAESVCKILLREAEEARASGTVPFADPKKICIIGGCGKMGGWLEHTLTSSGHTVTLIDKRARNGLMTEDAAGHDVVIIATPISSVDGILKDLDRICGDQLIFDISSLKSPFLSTLKEIGSRKRVCSVHPMFGPGARSMYDRNLIVCDCGNKEAADAASALFAGRGGNIVRLDADDHDRYMSYVLGLSHAVNIAFFTAIERSGIPFGEFMKVASTTFRKNVDTNESVALEDPHLYYEIQHLNARSEKVWSEFSDAVQAVRKASLSEDPGDFTELMMRGREFFTDL